MMDEAMKLLIQEISEDVKEIKRDVKVQNGRLRKVEINQAKIVGGVAVLVVVIPIVLKFIF